MSPIFVAQFIRSLVSTVVLYEFCKDTLIFIIFWIIFWRDNDLKNVLFEDLKIEINHIKDINCVYLLAISNKTKAKIKKGIAFCTQYIYMKKILRIYINLFFNVICFLIK